MANVTVTRADGTTETIALTDTKTDGYDYFGFTCSDGVTRYALLGESTDANASHLWVQKDGTKKYCMLNPTVDTWQTIVLDDLYSAYFGVGDTTATVEESWIDGISNNLLDGSDYFPVNEETEWEGYNSGDIYSSDELEVDTGGMDGYTTNGHTYPLSGFLAFLKLCVTANKATTTYIFSDVILMDTTAIKGIAPYINTSMNSDFPSLTFKWKVATVSANGGSETEIDASSDVMTFMNLDNFLLNFNAKFVYTFVDTTTFPWTEGSQYIHGGDNAPYADFPYQAFTFATDDFAMALDDAVNSDVVTGGGKIKIYYAYEEN